MVRRSSLILIFSLLFLTPGAVFSLGLGDIDVDSALNQPLNAHINLISARAEELDEMRVELAPADVFDRVGVPRPYFLTQLKFEPVSMPDGRVAIRVTSKDPVREPFLTFLVEVSWPKGRLLREYTVLLDPPEFAQQQAPQISTPAAAPEPVVEEPVVEEPVVEEVAEEVVEETATEEVVVSTAEEVTSEPVESEPVEVEEDIEAIRARMDRALGIDHSEPVIAEDAAVEEVEETSPTAEELEEAVIEETVAAKPKLEPLPDWDSLPDIESESIPAGDYTTVKGDTLSEIAKATRGSLDISINQMMLAIQQANPEAFIKDNINLLKSGVVLRIPDEVDTEIITSEKAVAEVARQNGLWREYRGQVTEKMVAANVDAPDLVEEVAEPTDDLASQAKEELEEVVKETPQAKQDLNILATEGGEQTDSGTTQLAGGEELEKLQKEQALLKELVQSRDKENEDLKSRVEALESMLEKKDKIINIQNDQLNNLKESLDEETNKALEAERQLQELSAKEAAQLEAESAQEAEPVQEETPQVKAEEVKPPEVEPVAETEEPLQTEQAVSQPKLEPLPDWDSLPEIELPGEEAVVAETETPAEEVKPTETQQPEQAVETQPPEQVVEEEPTPPVAEAPEQEGIVQKLLGFLEPLKSIGATIRENSGIGAAALAVVAVILGLFAWRQKRSAKRIETMSMGMPEPLEDDQFDDILDETIVTPKDAPVQVHEEPSAAEAAFGPTAHVDAEEVEAAQPSSSEAIAPDDVLEEADVYISYGLHQQAQDLLNDAIASEPGRNDYKVKLAEVFYSAKDQEGFEKHAQSIKYQLGESSNDWKNIMAMGKEIAPTSALFAGAAAAGVAASVMDKPEAADIDIGLQTGIHEPLSDDDLEDTVVDNAAPDEEEEGLDFNIDEQVTESFDDDPVASKIMEANETSDILNFDIDDLADLEDEPDTATDLEVAATGLHEATGIHEAIDIDEEMTEELEEVGLQTTMNDLNPLDMDEEDMDTTVALQTDEDFEIGLDTATTPEDPDATAAYMTSSNLEQEATEQFDASNLDTEFLDPAEATVAQTATDLEELGPPSLIEEVGTKLDLAKAFVDMGDSDAAKETLIEVINEGDESQIKAAKDLMDKLGG